MSISAPTPRWYVLLGLWCVPALLNMMTWLTFSRVSGRPLGFGQALVGETPPWLLWVFLTPLVFWLGGRFPIRLWHQPGVIAAHIAGVIIAVLSHAAATLAGFIFAGVQRAPLLVSFANVVAQTAPFTVVVYAGMLKMRQALINAARVRE